ncbi:MAG TPA: tetratricopeptide repeat protein [Thermoanaerobaculia bacterium]|nr:tetratricopeptide repeat protein [Thermoanaerobaculia bacterium]
MGRKSRGKERQRAVAGSQPAATTGDGIIPARSIFGVSSTWWIAGALLAGIALIYVPVIGHEFTNFDDNIQISENEVVLDGLTISGFRWAFTTFTGANWYPLTWLSHMLDVELYGTKAGGHAMTNVALHACNALLLFFLLRRMTGSTVRSGVVAALFAFHPQRVESVAWISERKDVLSALLWLATTWFYVGWVRERSARRYFLVLVTFALALMAKPMVVTLPFALLLLDYWPLRRLSFDATFRARARGLVLEKLPLFAMSAVISFMTVKAQEGALAAVEALPPSERVQNALVSYVAYLIDMVWPAGLAFMYPMRPVAGWQAAAAMAVLIAMTAIALLNRRTRPWITFGWLWYVGILVPVIGIVQVGQQAMADRYSYLPIIGILVIVVWGIAELVESHVGGATAARAATVVVLVVLALLAAKQRSYWKNSITLFERALAVTTNNHVAHINLANAKLELGRLEEARAHAEEAVRIASGNRIAHAMLGLVASQGGDFETAARAFDLASQLDSGNAEYRYQLGLALGKLGRTEESAEQFLQAATLAGRQEATKTLRSHYRAQALLARDQVEEAIPEFVRARDANPRAANIRNDLGAALARMGRLDEAIAEYRRAIELEPRLFDAHMNLGAVLSRKGDDRGAIDHFSQAAELQPQSIEPRIYLALALTNVGRIREAIVQVDTALRTNEELGNRLFTDATRMPFSEDNLQQFRAFLEQQGGG